MEWSQDSREHTMSRTLDFAGLLNHGVVKFGLIKREELIKQLRDLADRIEKNERPCIALQRAYSIDSVENEEFALTTLVLEFAELYEAAPQGTKLYGNGESFPL